MMLNNFLNSARQQFVYYKTLGEKTFLQLSDDQLFIQLHAESNSIATIVKHLWGNMLSRWTDFLTTDGEKEWRQRDAEFIDDITDRSTLMEKWHVGWACLIDTLDALKENDFAKDVFIRGQKHTVVEAIHRQIAHYAYHIGQIVFIGKLLREENWMSLSIPKGKSKQYTIKGIQ